MSPTDPHRGSTNANEALQISLVQPGKDALNTLSTFHPQFTYPIFGEEERIFGYQGLRVNLRFAAHDLLPNVEVSYDKKFKAVGDTQATDVEDVLREWMPASEFLAQRCRGWKSLMVLARRRIRKACQFPDSDTEYSFGKGLQAAWETD